MFHFDGLVIAAPTANREQFIEYAVSVEAKAPRVWRHPGSGVLDR